MLIYHVSNIKY